MPGFSIRSARWGAPPNVAPPFPGKLLFFPVKHRYVKANSGFFNRLVTSAVTPDTEAYHPRWLTHLKSYFTDVHPLAPPPLPSIRHLPYLKEDRNHRVAKPWFLRYRRILQEDPGPPATTRPITYLKAEYRPHRKNLSVSYPFGALGGDAVGIPPEKPKSYLKFLRGIKHRVIRPQIFRTRIPVPVILPPTDKLYPRLVGLPKPHKYNRSFNFFKYRPRFVPTVVNKLSLIEFFNLRVRLDVKKAVDSGQIAAVSTDVGGTLVNFNRAFKDIDSVVGTVQETGDFAVVIDFVDIPNPTSFRVLVFNTAGTRVSKTVYWVARGII